MPTSTTQGKFITKNYLLEQLRNFKSQILDSAYAAQGGSEDTNTYTYTIEKDTSASGADLAARYQLYQYTNGSNKTAVSGSVIDIPKDYFLQNVSKYTLTAVDADWGNYYTTTPTPAEEPSGTSSITSTQFNAIKTQCSVTTFAAGQAYLEFTVITKGHDEVGAGSSVDTIYLDVSELIGTDTTYSAGYGIDIDSTNNNAISVTTQVATTTELQALDKTTCPTVVFVEDEHTFYILDETSGVKDWTPYFSIDEEDVVNNSIDFTTEFDISESGNI